MYRLSLVCLACLLAAGDGRPPAEPPPILVPYRLSGTKHVLVRVKINGKGPFNVVLDTGAPFVVFAGKLKASLGIPTDRAGWAVLDRLDVEGGVSLNKVNARFDDLYQLQGMNGLGLGGSEIHGLIGYPVLARYRITYDFTKPKLAWTKLDAEPDELPRRPARGAAPGGLDALGGIMKGVGQLFGMNQFPEPKPRGFLGLSVAVSDGNVSISHVLAGGPAERAGVRAGDILRTADGRKIETAADLTVALSKKQVGSTFTLAVIRSGDDKDFPVQLGGGF